MKVYQVGGAVRDRLLGIEVYDHDWVVVGASAELMLGSVAERVVRLAHCPVLVLKPAEPKSS